VVKHLLQNTFFHLFKLGYLVLDFLFQGFDFLINTIKVVCYFFLFFKVWLVVAEGEEDFEVFKKS
jgi:hypothetical protein